MNKSKTPIYIILMLLFFFSATLLKAQNLYINETDGTQTSYSLNDIKKITFSSGDMSVVTNSSDIYNLTGITFLNFEDITARMNDKPDNSTQSIKIYPNPVSDQLNLKVNTSISGNWNITIISIDGSIVYQKQQPSFKTKQINVSTLPPGIYYCRLNNEQTMHATKFIKQ